MAQQINREIRKKFSLLFIITLAVTLMIAFLAFSFYTKTFVFAEEPRPTTTEFTHPMEEITVNLKDGDHYLKTEIALGYGLEKDLTMIQDNELELRDTIIDILRNKSMKDIMPVEKTDALKDEIKKQLNQHFDQEIITDIYITEFLIQ